MKKNYLFMMGAMLLLMTGTALTACSSDDGNSEIPDVPTDPPVPEEEPFVGVRYMEDSVQIQMQLLNSDSVAVDAFKEGEDIIFKLAITNKSSDRVVATPMENFSDNIFC